MPEEESRTDTSKEPDSNAGIQPPRQPPGNQNPSTPPSDNNSSNNQKTIVDLEKDIRGGERWLIIIGIVTIFVNIGIGLIYWRQLIQMTKATRTSALGAYAACLGAQISRNALMETQNAEAEAHGSAVATVYEAMAATESERAEMQLILGNAEIRVGKDFGVQFNTSNAGKTAAIDLTMDLRLVFLPRSKDPDFRYPRNMSTHGYNGRAEPGPTFTANMTSRIAAIGPDGKLLIPAESDQREYLASRKDMILFGRMTYRDIFGAHHWRNFCQPFQTFPEGLIENTGHQKCTDYNQSDVGSELVRSAPTPQKPSSLPEITCKNPE